MPGQRENLETPAETGEPELLTELDTSAELALGKVKRRAGAMFWIACGWLAAVIIGAVFANVLPIPNPNTPDYTNLAGGPSWAHPFGGDYLGRDMLSRIVYGARTSLSLGFGASALSALVGAAIGIIAGYCGRAVERIITILMDVILAFPSLILMIAVAAIFGANLLVIILSLALVGVPAFARIGRAHTLVLRRREFVLAAQSYGSRPIRIVTREIAPGVLLPIISFGFVLAGIFILVGGSLSFLGLGVPPPTPTWGGMIAAGRSDLLTHPSQSLIPAAAMFVTILSVNVIGQDLQSRYEVRGSNG